MTVCIDQSHIRFFIIGAANIPKPPKPAKPSVTLSDTYAYLYLNSSNHSQHGHRTWIINLHRRRPIAVAHRRRSSRSLITLGPSPLSIATVHRILQNPHRPVHPQ
jgi:hypothetical protein